MIDPETLEKLRNTSPTERIAIIEMLLHSLKTEMPAFANQSQRPAFGFMQDTGKILGDVIELFGAIDYDPDYDYKKQRSVS
jgi:hypothetical protein